MRLVAATIAAVTCCAGSGAVAAQVQPSREAIRTTADLRGMIRREAVVSRSFRLRVDTAAGTLPGADGRDRIHQRVARSMIDLYPVRDEGFRLSAGSRFAQRRPAGNVRGLLYTPGGPSKGVLRTGLRGFNPAVTVGYQGEVAPRLNLGVEVGALKGHAWQRVDAGAEPRRNHDPVASIVNLDASLRF